MVPPIVVHVTTFAGWWQWLTPAIASASALIAWRALYNTRALARRKATIDLIEKAESSEVYREAHRIFSEVRRGNGFQRLAAPLTDKDQLTRQRVLDYLNHYELVSIGIRAGILDEAFYRAWMQGPFVRDWNAASGLIQGERWKRGDRGGWSYRPQVFAAYQLIACRWSSEALRLDNRSGKPPDDARAVGPGDEPLPEPTPAPELKPPSL